MLLRPLLALLAVGSAQCAVIGIDFGARFLKVGIIQPGTGIELVLNEATKRKSSSAAGFTASDERLYGDESYNLLGKLPDKQFVFSKLLLGKPLDSSEVKLFGELGFPYQFVEDDESKAVVYQYGNGTYKAEEAVAFVLSYAKQIAEKHAGSAVRDAVITVPPFFRHEERLAMMSAASIAGLNVLSLMHDNTAFAFKYGFDKEAEFTGEPTNVVFYDLGASSYKVSLVTFSSVVGKKNKTTGSMAVRGVAWDDTLGGWLFDKIVTDLLVEAFNEKHPSVEPKIDTSAKAMGKLRKEAERVKDILSANTMYKVGIEALYMDKDLLCVINREELEKRAEAYFPRLKAPLASVLEQANLTKEEVHRVEVIGGATRIPKVKEAAKEFFGRETLDGSLNGDEAGALGATLYAAKLSTSFRLREFTITDAYPHAIGIRMGTDAAADEPEAPAEGEAAEGEGEKASPKGKDKLLFKANTKFPHKKLITMSRAEDLQVSLGYRDADGTSTADPISTFNISGVSAAVERLSKDPKRTAIGKPKLSVTFALSASGLLEVSKAELALEMLEKYDDYELVPANETENATDADATADAAAGDAAPAEAEAAEAAADDAAAAAGGDEAANATAANATGNASGNATAAPKMTRVKVEKERKRMHYTTLKAESVALGRTLPISEAMVKKAIQRNLDLLAAEKTRAVNAEAKNVLESFIIETRSRVSTEEAVEQVSQEEERATISAEFEAGEDWLYEEGRDVDAAAYNKKKKELEKLTAPIFLRVSELEARPRTMTQAREAVNWTLTILQTYAEERPEVTEAERDHVSGMCANYTEWLDEVEAKQAELPLYEPPAFLSKHVLDKLEPIEKELRKLIRKPKPKPPKVKANATNGTQPNATAANATDAPEAAADAPPTADEKAEAEVIEEDDPPKEEL